MPTPNGRRRDCKTRVDLLFRVILRTHGPLGKRGETNAAPSARRAADTDRLLRLLVLQAAPLRPTFSRDSLFGPACRTL